MKQRILVLGLLALATLAVVACGGAATAPEAAQPAEAAMDTGTSDEMAKEDADSMAADEMAEDDETAKEDSDADAIKTGEADSMEKDDTGEAMTEEFGAMSKDESTGSMEAESSDTAEMSSESDMASSASEANEEMDKDALMDLPAWFSAELTDVNSGETLTVAGLEGKVVLVETMAIWCSNCLRQQKEVKALHEALGMEDDLVTLVLDIDPNENAEHLRDYAAKHGFDWTYVVAPREVAREIGQLYGDQFLNPPSTPMLIVDRHGEVHLLPFGRKSADDLQEALAPFLNDGM
jgi:hypothetical protein